MLHTTICLHDNRGRTGSSGCGGGDGGDGGGGGIIVRDMLGLRLLLMIDYLVSYHITSSIRMKVDGVRQVTSDPAASPVPEGKVRPGHCRLRVQRGEERSHDVMDG